MWKDNIEYIIKRYKRFLKEHGVYKRVLDIHLSSFHCKKYNINTLDRLLTICASPEYFLWKSDVFCNWVRTAEGVSYWWVLSSLWRELCITENFEELNDKYLAARCSDLLINTKNLADPNREKIIQMRERISKLANKLHKSF